MELQKEKNSNDKVGRVEASVLPKLLEENEELNFDVTQALTYLGDFENYLGILQDYALRGRRNWKKIEELYDKKDWENYAIEVHGIKSAMRTIGAIEVFEEARALEMAAKEGDFSFVEKNHETMINTFKRDITGIQNLLGITEESVKKPESKTLLKEISDQELDAKFLRLEDAAFSLDEKEMRKLCQEFYEISYKGKDIRDHWDEISLKLEKEDYISIWDLLESIFKS